MEKTLFLFVTCLVILCTGFTHDKPSLNCNRPNEEKLCVNPCPPERTCANRDIQFSCLAVVTPCTTKCVCKDGFYRNPLGHCVSKAECERCPGPHEYFSCGSACDNVCSTIHKQNRTNCPIVNVMCNEKCYCEDDYARNNNGVCVPLDKCEIGKPKHKRHANKERCPGPHEFFLCGTECDNVCTTLHKQNRTNCPIVNIKCNEKCYCEDGYARNTKGVCVPVDKCESFKPRYKRNANKEKCPGPHEFFFCGDECDNECATLHEQNRTNCPIVNKRCVLKCYCEDGYARNSKGICVPTDQCETSKSRHKRYGNKDKLCSDPNEVFAECKNPCPPETCVSLVAKFKCVADPPCKPRCVCKEGFLRKEEGAPCMPLRKCPAFS